MTDTAEHILQFFEYAHLTGEQQVVSRSFCVLAMAVFKQLPNNPERAVALRKLLEAKDAAVRASLARNTGGEDYQKRYNALCKSFEEYGRTI